jgi:hypothetical protein
MPFINSVRGTFGSQSKNRGVATPGGIPEALRQNPNSPLLPQGGTVSTSGGYRIHRFDYTGGTQTFVTSLSPTVEILSIAGGGSGGMSTSTNGNGGGGAGGLVYTSSFATSSATNLSIFVGAGASERGYENSRGNNGGNTTVTSLTTAVGGSGGSSSMQGFSSVQGGSGGGGAGNNSNGNTAGNPGISGQGYGGGTGVSWAGGGGGGAGGTGYNGSESAQTNRCDGGIGLSYSITGSTDYYAGGGGGGGNSSENAGRGWYGGARGYGTTLEDSYNSYPNSRSTTTYGWRNIDAINGYGGGGGAGSYWMNNAGSFGWSNRSGRGGHGVVIIRYPI